MVQSCEQGVLFRQGSGGRGHLSGGKGLLPTGSGCEPQGLDSHHGNTELVGCTQQQNVPERSESDSPGQKVQQVKYQEVKSCHRNETIFPRQ